MTNPSPCLLASVHILVGFATSKMANTGVVVRHSFTFVSAWLCSVVHMNSFLVLSSGLNGAISPAIVFVPDANWLTNPTNKCSYVHVVGLGTVLWLF